MRDEFGRIDVMVNDAGSLLLSPLDHLNVEDGLVGVAALPRTREERAGRIINLPEARSTGKRRARGQHARRACAAGQPSPGSDASWSPHDDRLGGWGGGPAEHEF